MNEETWLAICFMVFVLFAYKPIKKAILRFLDAKIKLIVDELHDAQHAKMEAEKEVQFIHAQIASAEEHHKEMLIRAKQEIDDLYEKRCMELTKAMEYRLKASETSLNQMIIDAAASVEGAFLDLVIETVENHMRKNASSKMDMQILKNNIDKEAA